jgi:hypothetical protein
MKRKHKYVTPLVLQSVRIQVERAFLDSVVQRIDPVETAGQKIEEVYDYSQPSSTLNHTWEN